VYDFSADTSVVCGSLYVMKEELFRLDKITERIEKEPIVCTSLNVHALGRDVNFPKKYMSHGQK
jgi:hypothetical protein